MMENPPGTVESPQTTDNTQPTTHHPHPSPIEQIQSGDLESRVIEALRTVYDPEIPVNIYELGLVYEVKASPSGAVAILMTLTSPMCPVAESLPPEVEQRVEAVDGVTSVKVNVTWEPSWGPERMSEAAKLQLGMM